MSDPYVQIANNTKLLVQRGKDSCLTAANLSITTNQDVRADVEVEFHIAWPPKHGRILVSNSVSSSFFQHDLKKGHVIYRHDGSGNSDTFNLTVKLKDAYLEVGVCVQVELEDHHHHSKVWHRKTPIVEEGKPVKLSRGRLQVSVILSTKQSCFLESQRVMMYLVTSERLFFVLTFLLVLEVIRMWILLRRNVGGFHACNSTRFPIVGNGI